MSLEIEQVIKGLMSLIDDLDCKEQKMYVDKVLELFEERKTLLAIMDNGG